MLPTILAFAIPSILALVLTRLVTNMISDIIYALLKRIVVSILRLWYNLFMLTLWILFLPLTILSKMTVSKSSPLRWILLLSLMALSAFVAYDISLHGNFEKSQTGMLLEGAGVLKHYQVLLVNAKVQYANASKWFSKNGPTFLKQAADYIKPYLVLMKNLLIIFSNAVVNGVINLVKYVAVKLPLLHETIEFYCPGITQWTQQAVQSGWLSLVQFVQYLASQALVLLSFLFQYLKQALATSIDYLQKNVFVGEYSPENLQKLAIQGASVTQEYISSSVTWLSHKLTGLTSQ